jgi:PAS domain S-box-containing protein
MAEVVSDPRADALKDGRSTLRRYSVAVVATLAVLVLRLLLQPVLENASPFLLFALAVMVSAWYGGFGPGLFATLVGAVAADYFLLHPLGQFSRGDNQLARTAVFVIVGGQISWLSGALHNAKRRAEREAHAARQSRDALRRAHDELEQRVRERTAELHFQKTLLESQSEASRDAIVAVSSDGRIIFSNQRFEEVWRNAGREGTGRLEDVRQSMAEMLAEPQTADPLGTAGEWRGRADEGGYEEVLLRDGRTLERYSAPIVSADGTTYGRVWYFRDITERKQLEKEIVEAGERERRRIGQDLHDDLCQQLSGIACLGRVLQRRLDVESNDAAEEAGEIARLVQQATQRARDLARGLQPVNFTKDGLDAALVELCDSSESMFGVCCTFRGDGDVEVRDPDVAAHLYRIAQEAIHNAVRHGQAHNVTVDLVAAGGGRVVLTVEDNGVGIPDDLPQQGMGLHTMSFRARMVGGLLSVERGLEGGTIVTCSLRQQPAPNHAEPSAEPSDSSSYTETTGVSSSTP